MTPNSRGTVESVQLKVVRRDGEIGLTVISRPIKLTVKLRDQPEA
jgi:hypothetical protein